MSDKVKFGLSNVHYAIISAVSDDGVPTYAGSWKALPLAVSMTADVDSNSSAQYADNQKVYETSSITGASITLEMSVISDDFKKDVLGYKTCTNGALIQPTDAVPVRIALAFQIEGDESKTIVHYFNCSVTDPATENANTKTDSVTFSNESVAITAYPVKFSDNIHYIKQKIKTGDTGFATFFTDTPALPTIAS